MIALKKIWKNEYFKTVIAIILIVAIVLGFFFGLQLALNTSTPMRTVESGSMYIPYQNANLWTSLTHPFYRTFNIGDIIIIQGVDPKTLNTNYPNSDIIVFRDPLDPNSVPIVHRIYKTEVVNGTIYFITKGDGNGNPWPQTPTSGLDPWDYNNPPGVPQNLVIGKVVMRVPWFGWIALGMQQSRWGLPVIIGLILMLVVLEFIIPILREKKKPEQQKTPLPPSQMSL